MNIYLFDFDGTLVDSMPTFVSSMLRILDENDISYGEDIIKILTPLGLNGSAEYFLGLGVPGPKEQIMLQMKKYMMDAYFYEIPAKEHVVETLKILKDRGARLNILTASPHITLDACLKRLGIHDLFENVWSCDDFDTTKADPDIYRRAAQKLGVPVEQVLFLDDNYNADKTAKEAGMQGCGVYDPSSEEYVEDMKQLCHKYIFDFTELL